jgi:hypothetical protein
MSEEVYYFGCVDVAGHYMHAAKAPRSLEERRAEHDVLYSNPWGTEVDSGLCPSGPEIEGRALLHHKDGWTALSFWDRSVDSRGKCNSNFLAKGTFDFEKMLELARENFPHVMKRFKFEIVQAQP